MLRPYNHRYSAGKINLADAVATGVGGEELFGDASLEFLLGKVAIVHFPRPFCVDKSRGNRGGSGKGISLCVFLNLLAFVPCC